MDGLCGRITVRFWSSFSEMTSDGNPETTTSIGLLHLIDVLGLSWFVFSTMLVELGIDWTFVLLFFLLYLLWTKLEGIKVFYIFKKLLRIFAVNFFLHKILNQNMGYRKSRLQAARSLTALSAVLFELQMIRIQYIYW